MQRVLFLSILTAIVCGTPLRAQLINHILPVGEFPAHEERDHKCGPYDEKRDEALRAALGSNWGYGYSDLLSDLDVWRELPGAESSVLGHSVQGREIHEITFTDRSIPDSEKQRIYIHARTHPNEIQSFRVAEEMIRLLGADEPLSRDLQRHFIFHVIPMYNPDGVEMQSGRWNANGVDLEREWAKENPEPEAAALRARFSELMGSPSPIRLALNLHSAYACKRFFYFHAAGGTSHDYTEIQRSYIAEVVERYPDGIEPWDYLVSWVDGRPDHFPESWFWERYREDVLALTYEDMNCAAAGSYDTTAAALIIGAAAYLNMPSTTPRIDGSPAQSATWIAERNEIRILGAAGSGPSAIRAYRTDGTQVLDGEVRLAAGTASISTSGWPSGVYFVVIERAGASTAIGVVISR